MRASASCPSAQAVTSMYSLSGASSLSLMLSLFSARYCFACSTAGLLQSCRTSNSSSGRPISAPSATAIGSPVMPVPGMPTPIAFFRILALNCMSIVSGTRPSSSFVLATHNATAIGSVQPMAGTTCLCIRDMIAFFSSAVSIMSVFYLVSSCEVTNKTSNNHCIRTKMCQSYISY